MQRQTCQSKSQGLVGRNIQRSLFKGQVDQRETVRPITDDSVLPFRSFSSTVLARRLLINSLKFPSTLSSDISFSIQQIFIDMMLAELGYSFWSIFLNLVKLLYFLFHSYKLMFLFCSNTYPAVELQDHWAILFSVFLRKLCTAFYSSCAHSHSQQCTRAPFLHILANT